MYVRRGVTLGLFGVMVIAFFLPWVAVSCYGQRALDISGFQFATAVPAEEMSPGKVSAKTSLGERADVPQALQIAAVAAIIGAASGVLIFAVERSNVREIYGVASLLALMVVGALIWFMVGLGSGLDRLILLPFMTVTDPATGTTTWLDTGFILMFVAAVVAFFHALHCRLSPVESGRVQDEGEDASSKSSFLKGYWWENRHTK